VIAAGVGDARPALGALLVAGACVCWGADNAITARLDRYTPATITVAKGVVAGSVNLALGLALEPAPSWRMVLAALAIGSVGYGLSITLWIRGARRIGAARGQAVFALAPFVGAALAWPMLDERPQGRVLLAFAVAFAGVAIVMTAGHGHVHRHAVLVHAHPIDPHDPHHAPGAIDVLDGDAHRHHALTHEHAHLPDEHHRHDH